MQCKTSEPPTEQQVFCDFLDLYEKELTYKNVVLNNFKLIDTGTNGKVYKCNILNKDTYKNKTCAAKVINITGLNEEQIQLIQNESNILEKIHHPNVINLELSFIKNNYDVQVLGYGKYVFNLYIIVTEYCEGGNLFNYLNENKRISKNNKYNIFKKIVQVISDISTSVHSEMSVCPLYECGWCGSIMKQLHWDSGVCPHCGRYPNTETGT